VYDGDYSPSWSPGDTRIAFFRTGNHDDQILTMSALGGDEVLVATGRSWPRSHDHSQ
jgi:hypothetical protein